MVAETSGDSHSDELIRETELWQNSDSRPNLFTPSSMDVDPKDGPGAFAEPPKVDRDAQTSSPNTDAFTGSFNPVDAPSVSSGLMGQEACPVLRQRTGASKPQDLNISFEPCVCEIQPNSCAAELLARQILGSGSCSHQQVLDLMDLLPCEQLARGNRSKGTEKSFTTGAYSQGPLVGLRKHSKSHPSVTKLLVILAKSFFPSLTFTTVALFRDVKTSRHADRGNLPGSLNGVAALSTFVNGHIKLHTSRGPKLLDVATHPVLFDPTLDHETCDWSGGPRLVLVAFSVCNLDLMPTVELTQLRDFGLPLPSLSVTVPSGNATHKVTSAMAGDKGLVLQLFAGPARLAQTLQKNGFDVLAFDRSGVRARFPVQSLDICDSEDFALFSNIMSEQPDRVVLLHLSPSPNACREAGFVQAFCAIIRRALDWNLRICIESFAASELWKLPEVVKLLSGGQFQSVRFDLCMHGGHQNRPVRLESNSDLFSALALSCNRLHKHATDAMQHPSDRGAYPWLLCHRIADLLSLQAASRDMQPSLLGPATSMLRLALDRQGRYRKPLVSEFRHYDAWAFTPDSDADRSKVLQLYPNKLA